MMKRRQNTKSQNTGHGRKKLRTNTEYRTLHREIKNKYKWAQEEWLNEKCAEFEKKSITDKENMRKRIRELTGLKISS